MKQKDKIQKEKIESHGVPLSLSSCHMLTDGNVFVFWLNKNGIVEAGCMFNSINIAHMRDYMALAETAGFTPLTTQMLEIEVNDEWLRARGYGLSPRREPS